MQHFSHCVRTSYLRHTNWQIAMENVEAVKKPRLLPNPVIVCDPRNVCDLSQLFLPQYGPLQTPRPQQPAAARGLI